MTGLGQPENSAQAMTAMVAATARTTITMSNVFF
jgi:hypothetical protein